MSVPTYGFILTQVAGHVTYYQSIKPLLSARTSFRSVWNEVHYHRPGGVPERLAERFRFLPAYPLGVLRATLDVRQGLLRDDYDALFLNSHEGIFFPERIRRIPTIYYADATPLQIDRMPGYGESRDPGPLAILKFRMFRTFVHRVRCVAAWSEWARASFIEDYGLAPESVIVFPPGVDLARWRYVDRSERADGARPPRVLFVGGDFRRKGGDVLLDWYRRQPAGTCELDVVTREPVEPCPGVSVHHGLSPNSPDLMALYDRADVFVLPSLGECFGIATIEAMATGLPVIQTDVGGVRDIIPDGVSGSIIPPGDLSALDRALQPLVADPERRWQMGRAGRDRVEERFDLAKHAAKLPEYLDAIRR